MRHLLTAFAFALLVTSCTTPEKPVDPKIAKLKLPDGFVAEHLHSPSEQGQGSWVAMAFDDKGRMITSDQYGALYRFPIPSIGDTTSLQIQPLPLEGEAAGDSSKLNIGYAQGLLYAFNSLYVMVNFWGDDNFSKSSGLYRLEDTNNNDMYDKMTLLRNFNGAGEHGPHSIKLSPDKKSLYMVAGNFTDLPEMNSYRLPKVWSEDNLFPHIPDPIGHATDRTAPGGWIAKFSPDGKEWELVSAGYRNTYDITFNADGELFAYDSDMEWDLGMPWYRPTRICHVTSGSEYGWRTGSINWPQTFADALPPVINIGQGSPTNFVSGEGAAFPEKYQRALYASDWSFGIIHAIHLTPSGSTYTATSEEFLSGAPLPLTDGVFGPDGAFYFITGGRRLESDLYRVYYKGTDSTKPVDLETTPTPEANIRKMLEAFHQPSGANAVDSALKYLGHSDRFVRYAARVALEHQPFNAWATRMLSGKEINTLIEGAIATAHQGTAASRDRILDQMMTTPYASLSDAQQLAWLRAAELLIIRLGKPSIPVTKQITAYLNDHYPSGNNTENRALAKILITLEAPGVVEKTVQLLREAKDEPGENLAIAPEELILRNPQYGLDIASTLSNVPPQQQIYLATLLSSARSGWTTTLRDEYFKWYRSAFGYKGGRSYIGFIDRARQLALAQVDKKDQQHYREISGQELLDKSGNDLAGLPEPKGPWHEWKIDEAQKAVAGPLSGRNFENGKNMFAATLCKTCHAMRGEGGAIGPDLTQLGTRFSAEDMIVHILDPNKEISDQYAATVFEMADGKSITGTIINENEKEITLSQNPFSPNITRTISKSDVKARKRSTVSLMPPGLIYTLGEDELKDLVAYLVAGGDQGHQVFK